MAGCISYFFNNNEYHKVTDWRNKLKMQLNIDGKKKGFEKWSYFDPTVNFVDNVKFANNATILKQNIFYLNHSDIMVVNIDKLEESPGTVYEIVYFGLQNKPIIAFGESDWINSPHISQYVDVVLPEIEVIKYLDAMYYQ